MNEYLDLFWTFLKIGASTFGGGYAMIPVLDRELIRGKGWITMDEVMDYYTIAQITPGIVAVNVSTFVGYKRKGIPGGILATAGFILPGVTLMAIISLFISRFAGFPAVQHAFTGIRVAVGALILNTIVKLVKGFFRGDASSGAVRARIMSAISVVIFIAAFAISALLDISPVYVVLGAGLLGWLLFRKPQSLKNSGEAQ
jgi:chromate transporter